MLSWNILAPVYVRPIDTRTGCVQAFAAFAWAEPASERLDWDVRRTRVSALLARSRADVICLQEVQFSPDEDGTYSAPAWLRAALPEYAVCIPGQKELAEIAARNARVLRQEVAVGNAVLHRPIHVQRAGGGARQLERGGGGRPEADRGVVRAEGEPCQLSRRERWDRRRRRQSGRRGGRRREGRRGRSSNGGAAFTQVTVGGPIGDGAHGEPRVGGETRPFAAGVRFCVRAQ